MTFDDTLASRLAFNNINDSTRRTLNDLRPIAMEYLPKVLDDFYAKVTSTPEISRLFPRQEVVNSAKSAQARHWELLFDAKFDDTYIRSVTRIGETHQRLGLEPRWYIGGYRHMLSNMIRHIETSITARFPRQAMYEKKAEMIDALLTAAMLDMDIVISIYLEAGIRAKHSELEKVTVTFDENIRKILQDVTSMSDGLRSSADSLKATASETEVLSTNVAAASEQASASVKSVAASTEHLGSSVAEISKQVQESLRIAHEAVQQADSANGRIAELSQAASRIGDVIKIINAIATQTNLLALNATIEAARAGEAGKGFAVVAQEVKALASQTASATDEITSQINGMQASTDVAVGAISEISNTIAAISRNSQAIFEAVDLQNSATREMSYNINMAASGSSEVAANIVAVNKGAEKTGHAAADVHNSAQTLTVESKMLQTEVDNFLKALRVA
ncbi:MAG TPA: globin-coupled sensor protein [Xanthobacteraceae bacterium]|nr:globin-coupled sensor protein [Xanthobacteraceae bacterium]